MDGFGLFGGVDSKEVAETPTTSLTGLQMVEDAKSLSDKAMIEWVSGSVNVLQGSETLSCKERFLPIDSSKGLNGKLNWEQPMCSLAGLDYYEVVRHLPFQKDRYLYYSFYLGCAPKRWVKMYNACMVKAFIPDDLYPLAKRVCKGGRGLYVPYTLTNLNKNKDLIRQCISDGMESITPLILYISRLPEELTITKLRGFLGKSLWKSVLKNSISRNRMLCVSYEASKRQQHNHTLSELQQLPSGLLARTETKRVVSLLAGKLIKDNKLICKENDIHIKIDNIILDTKSMCNQLGKDLPKQHTTWDLPKWEERHQYYTEQLHLKNYSKDKFNSVYTLDKEYKSFCGNYTAVLIDNAFDIKNEGVIMHHCVGSYSSRVKEGSYLVLSILDKDGSRRSTLGLYRGSRNVSFSQHYGYCNKYITCDNENQFAKDIILNINSQLKKGV